MKKLSNFFCLVVSIVLTLFPLQQQRKGRNKFSYMQAFEQKKIIYFYFGKSLFIQNKVVPLQHQKIKYKYIMNDNLKQRYQNLTDYTNVCITQWYANVAEAYGVIGTGEVSFTNDSVVVNYTEDGVSQVWEMAFYPEYFKEHPIEWVFNCWSELC